IVFLDRLGNQDDEALVRSRGLRLRGGQGNDGGWTYNCTTLTPAAETGFLRALQKTRPVQPIEVFAGPDGRVNPEWLGLDKATPLDQISGADASFDTDTPFKGEEFRKLVADLPTTVKSSPPLK